MTEPKCRPMLFSGPLVRAILEGRKTVTRRPMKPQPVAMARIGYGPTGRGHWPMKGRSNKWACPFGEPKDLIWVRETWGAHFMYNGVAPRDIYRGNDGGDCTFYRADGHVDGGCSPSQCTLWRSSIHMPRWASRLTLEVTGVRAERVQDITEDQAQAEGVLPDFTPDFDAAWLPRTPAAAAFANAWQRMYAKREGLGWDANPWVWVVEFEVVPAGGTTARRPAPRSAR